MWVKAHGPGNVPHPVKILRARTPHHPSKPAPANAQPTRYGHRCFARRGSAKRADRKPSPKHTRAPTTPSSSSPTTTTPQFSTQKPHNGFMPQAPCPGCGHWPLYTLSTSSLNADSANRGLKTGTCRTYLALDVHGVEVEAVVGTQGAGWQTGREAQHSLAPLVHCGVGASRTDRRLPARPRLCLSRTRGARCTFHHITTRPVNRPTRCRATCPSQFPCCPPSSSVLPACPFAERR